MAEAGAPSVATETEVKPAALTSRITGSLTRRMIAIATIWISVLLIGGGYALDRVLTGAITRNFDSSLEYVLIAMIRSSASPVRARSARRSSRAPASRSVRRRHGSRRSSRSSLQEALRARSSAASSPGGPGVSPIGPRSRQLVAQ